MFKKCWNNLYISGARYERKSINPGLPLRAVMCLRCVFPLGSFAASRLWQVSLILIGSGPAGNTQPWVWNVFTFWACYKLSAKTNFAWLGRSRHLAQMLFGSNVFQRFALSILTCLYLTGGSPSQMWTLAKGKARCSSFGVCVSVPALMCLYVRIHGAGTLPICLHWQDPTFTWYSINSKGINAPFDLSSNW